MSTPTEAAEVFTPSAPKATQPLAPWIIGAGAAVIVGCGIWFAVIASDANEPVGVQPAAVQVEPATRAVDDQTERASQSTAVEAAAAITPELVRGVQAEAARLTALAEHHRSIGVGIDGSPELTRGLQAEADRLTALAARYQAMFEGFGANPEAVRQLRAYAARVSAMATFYANQGIGTSGSPELIRALQTEADRLNRLVEQMGSAGSSPEDGDAKRSGDSSGPGDRPHVPR